MTTLGHYHGRTPDWQVQSVFDPDGEGYDFAYTIGLHERGLPELHIWGRPPLGDDPGEDWMFSPQDRCRILNDLGWKLIDGQLRVGDRWEEPYDAGLVTVRFRLDPPGDRDDLEALGIAPGAEVLPVRWSLHRSPIGRPRPLTKRALQRATGEYAAVLDRLGESASCPPGWSLPPVFEQGGEFGPLSPMLAGRVAEFWSADAITLSNLLYAATTVFQGGFLTWPATVAAAVARENGRVELVAKLDEVAAELVGSRMAEPSWAQARIEIASAIGMPLAEATRERFERGVHHKLSELLWSVLCTEVVADRLTPEQRLCGRGAWLTGLGPVGELPGPQWRAPKCVIDSVAAVLAGLDAQGLRDVAMRHSDESLEDYRILADRLHGWAMIAPAGCPWRGTLDRLPGVLEARRALRHACGSSGVAALADSVLVRRDELQEWATVMTSAACHRSRLTPAEVAVLTAPFLDLLPELASVVNAYAAAGGG